MEKELKIKIDAPKPTKEELESIIKPLILKEMSIEGTNAYQGDTRKININIKGKGSYRLEKNRFNML